MYNDDDISGGFNNLAGPYQFLNQAAVTNAVASGQNIDWAQLAQQWIQMRDSTTTAIGVTNFSTSDGGTVSVHSSLKYEEKGEADMDMDDEEHMEERTIVDRIKRSSVMQHHPSNANRQWFTEKSNVSNNESRTDVSSQKANHWSNTPTILQTACDPHVANRQTNSTAHIPSLLSMNVPHPNEIRALPDNTTEQSNQQAMMDAAKRKALPAWIREGLEKMEREKQKQIDKHFRVEQSEDSDDGSPVHFKVATVNSLNLETLDDEDDDTIEAPVLETSTKPIVETGVSVESEVYKSYEQKLTELMVVVRRTLTELLLEVTNEEISKVANEAFKSYKMKASSAQVIHKSALSSITSKLGLAAYDDSSSDECSDDTEDENSPVRKTFPSESGNDSEEDIKNTVRSKRRAFAKIANEIEERVAAAASKEEEKLKYFSSKDEASAGAQKQSAVVRNTGPYQREADAKDTYATQISAGSSGKLFERDTGETTETMLQALNGKLQKERGARKERTTRFSDNRDSKYLALAASASYISGMQPKDQIITTTISSQSLTSLGQTAYKTTAVPSCSSATVETGTETNQKHKNALSPEKITDRDRDKKQSYSKKSQRRRSSRDSTPGSQSSSSSSSSSSSTSSDLDSSTSNSSDNSRYSNKSHRKHSSHVSNADKSKTSSQSQRDRRDDRKYTSSYADKDRDSYHSRYRNDRSRSRSRHGRRRHGSHDSDKDYSRRKHDSRYSSSHSRSRNSSHRYHDYSTSNSRSSYSSSSNRRH